MSTFSGFITYCKKFNYEENFFVLKTPSDEDFLILEAIL